MFYQALLLIASLSHIGSAEYVINFLSDKSSGNNLAKALETVILDDGFQGCVSLPLLPPIGINLISIMEESTATSGHFLRVTAADRALVLHNPTEALGPTNFRGLMG